MSVCRSFRDLVLEPHFLLSLREAEVGALTRHSAELRSRIARAKVTATGWRETRPIDPHAGNWASAYERVWCRQREQREAIKRIQPTRDELHNAFRSLDVVGWCAIFGTLDHFAFLHMYGADITGRHNHNYPLRYADEPGYGHVVNLAVQNNVAGPEILQFAMDEGVDLTRVGTRKGRFALDRLLRQEWCERSLESLGVLLLAGCVLHGERPPLGHGWDVKDSGHLLRVFGILDPPCASLR